METLSAPTQFNALHSTYNINVTMVQSWFNGPCKVTIVQPWTTYQPLFFLTSSPPLFPACPSTSSYSPTPRPFHKARHCFPPHLSFLLNINSSFLFHSHCVPPESLSNRRLISLLSIISKQRESMSTPCFSITAYPTFLFLHLSLDSFLVASPDRHSYFPLIPTFLHSSTILTYKICTHMLPLSQEYSAWTDFCYQVTNDKVSSYLVFTITGAKQKVKIRYKTEY